MFGVECCGDVGVVRRLGADETRDDPHGRGGGRGAPHEIHGGRRQALGQVLLIHGDGLLLDRGGEYIEVEALMDVKAGASLILLRLRFHPLVVSLPGTVWTAGAWVVVAFAVSSCSPGRAVQ